MNLLDIIIVVAAVAKTAIMSVHDIELLLQRNNNKDVADFPQTTRRLNVLHKTVGIMNIADYAGAVKLGIVFLAPVFLICS